MPAIAQLSPRLIQTCLQYRWPGNLRELGNFAKRYVVFQDENQAISELEEKMRDTGIPVNAHASVPGQAEAGLKSLMKDLKHSAEVKVIEEALSATNWNRRMAALRLKISCKALRYKIKQYHILPPKNADRSGVLQALRSANG